MSKSDLFNRLIGVIAICVGSYQMCTQFTPEQCSAIFLVVLGCFWTKGL